MFFKSNPDFIIKIRDNHPTEYVITSVSISPE